MLRLIILVTLAGTLAMEADIDPTETMKLAPVDEKTLPTKNAMTTRAVRLPDAGLAYVAEAPDGGTVRLTQSPCAWKPTVGAACYKTDGGNPGVQNTMGPGQFAGAGCVRKSCVIIAGQPDDDTQLRVPKATITAVEVEK